MNSSASSSSKYIHQFTKIWGSEIDYTGILVKFLIIRKVDDDTESSN